MSSLSSLADNFAEELHNSKCKDLNLVLNIKKLKKNYEYPIVLNVIKTIKNISIKAW